MHSVNGIDSLTKLQKKLQSEGEVLGSIVALGELGTDLRNNSRFEEALRIHNEGLKQAESIDDTLEWVKALNNIGTDYRRMGVLDAAQSYHYMAWKMCERSTNTSFTAKKNRVMSLNGLGNIYLSLGNYARADSALRIALAGERELHSNTGQAINYANLGSILEKRGELDSAWAYYRKSMALNMADDNELGIALCHTYFGSLYEKTQQYDNATKEYESAYQLMQASKDEWHALNALIALAGIYLKTRQETKALAYLETAKEKAKAIKSKEHLADIYDLYYQYYKRLGDYSKALSSYEYATAMNDSLVDMKKVNHIQNISLSIERNNQHREVDKARQRLQQQKMASRVGDIILGFIVIVLIGTLAVFHYIQRIHRRNHLALKRLSLVRENFFTNITHEFRTPLTVILGLSHDLQKEDSGDVRNKAVTIERQGKALLTLINQLLDISKIKSAVGDPSWRHGNITSYIAMVVESYREYAKKRNIELQYLSRENVEMDFVPDYLNKMLNNLISNAFKFTPDYGKVGVATWKEGEWYRIDVNDTGVGMSKEVIAHAFEPFYQGESYVKNIGTGVGLALVKQIIDAAGGKIVVDSKAGAGTTFHVSLPIRNESSLQVANAEEKNIPLLPETYTQLEDSENDEAQLRLLIIEDNLSIASYIGSQFSDKYAVSYANNGDEGLAKAMELVPDLIIIDLMMPGMDGLEMCRKVRSNEIIDHIPIIVITAKVTEEERIKGLKAGADAYLTKPFNPDELRTRVEMLIDRHRHLYSKFRENAGTHKQEEYQLTDIDRRFLAKVTDIIYLHLNRRKNIDVASIASAMCMSGRQFYRKINAITGSTPTAYIQRVKIERAQKLLDKYPQMSLAEIADKCGYNDYSNFVRAFKNVYNCTPTEYRRSRAGLSSC